MLIGVATAAFCVKTKKGAPKIDLTVFHRRRFGNITRLVTFSTLDISVLTIERKAGLIMIERVPAILEIDQFKVATVMFNVAHLTLFVIRAAMETEAGLALLLDRGMTGQAIFSNSTTVVIMALFTVFDALEKGVALMQLTGGNLRDRKRRVSHRNQGSD